MRTRGSSQPTPCPSSVGSSLDLADLVGHECTTQKLSGLVCQFGPLPMVPTSPGPVGVLARPVRADLSAPGRRLYGPPGRAACGSVWPCTRLPMDGAMLVSSRGSSAVLTHPPPRIPLTLAWPSVTTWEPRSPADGRSSRCGVDRWRRRSGRPSLGSACQRAPYKGPSSDSRSRQVESRRLPRPPTPHRA